MLAGASARLAASLDLSETLAAVGRVVVPEYADWCFVELLRADGSIERALIEHADPARRRFAEEYDRRYPLDPESPVGSPKVIRTGEPDLLSDLPDAFLEQAAADPEQLRLLRGVGFRSSLIVPMRVRGKVIGDLALAYADSGRRFGPDDVPVAQALADRCAVAIDNARLFTELRAAEIETRRSRDELRATLEGMADAVTVQTPDMRIVYANDAAARMYGVADGEALAALLPSEHAEHFEMRDEQGEPLDPARLPGRRALAGEDPEPLTMRYRGRGSDEWRWARIKATAVREDGGEVRLAINVVEDITELKRSEQTQRFLAEAGRTLSSSLDYERTLAAVAELAVAEVADWCAIDLAADDGPQRVVVAHLDPELRALADEVRRDYPPHADRSRLNNVLDRGRAVLIPQVTEEMLQDATVDDRHLELVRALGIRSVMIVPMPLRGRVLGAITLVSSNAGRRFSQRDLALAEQLGLLAATAVENARLYRRASDIAHTLQTSLLPPLLPDVAGVTLAAAYRPAGDGLEVGGDFYDVFSVADDQWYLVVGDVCGKGAEAAAITALVRYTLRTAAVRLRSPAAILRWVDEAMLRQEAVDGRFCTVACAHLDLGHERPRVTVACGGHPLPIVVRAAGGVQSLGAPGTLLGLVPELQVQERSTELAPGDALVLYTDGLTEARAPAVNWGPDELSSVAAPVAGAEAEAIVAHLVAAALVDGAAPRDDLAVLAARVSDMR